MMRFPVWLATMALVFAGCGGERQDAGEPDESFALEVVDASFPERQSVAEAATLALEVRNIDDLSKNRIECQLLQQWWIREWRAILIASQNRCEIKAKTIHMIF
jgi:hypothetical protein